MQLPSLRQPAAASVLAGVLGAGVVDALLTARGGATGSVVLLALGLYGTAALVAAGGAALVMAGLRGAWPPGWGSLADDADPIALPRFRSLDLRVEANPDLTPVSDADRAVELRLRARIAAERPG